MPPDTVVRPDTDIVLPLAFSVAADMVRVAMETEVFTVVVPPPEEELIYTLLVAIGINDAQGEPPEEAAQ